eukprot:1539726-Rhodomonas_salina.1
MGRWREEEREGGEVTVAYIQRPHNGGCTRTIRHVSAGQRIATAWMDGAIVYGSTRHCPARV